MAARLTAYGFFGVFSTQDGFAFSHLSIETDAYKYYIGPLHRMRLIFFLFSSLSSS